MGRRSSFVLVGTLIVLAGATPALACGGLIGPRSSVNLLRTTTLAAYHRGVEHYVTAFTYAGAGTEAFGSIVPLPGVPSKVERGGDWTLQRLVREVDRGGPGSSDAPAFAAAPRPTARVLQRARIDALDITILEGGGRAVVRWAEENGFALSPDAADVLEFYARRSPVFMAARFNAARAAARGQLDGDGTPIHLTIPTPDPWVPLRILALGKQAAEPVLADVFLLTERAPAVLPAPEGARRVPSMPGLSLQRSEPASASLLTDLRSDKGMRWLPARGMWLSYFRISAQARQLRYDLAVDASGAGRPSWVAAGLPAPVDPPVAPVTVSRPILQRVAAAGATAEPAAGASASGTLAVLAASAALGVGIWIGGAGRRQKPRAAPSERGSLPAS